VAVAVAVVAVVLLLLLLTPFLQDDPTKVLFAKDVVSFAQAKGLYPKSAAANDFSFSDVYDPVSGCCCCYCGCCCRWYWCCCWSGAAAAAVAGCCCCCCCRVC